MSWYRVGLLEEIPRRGARVVTTQHGDIALFRTSDDEIFALANRCPHRQGPLSEGIVHGTNVTCPLHEWVIELASGEAVAPDKGCTPVFPVKLDAGQVFIDLPEAPASPDHASPCA